MYPNYIINRFVTIMPLFLVLRPVMLSRLPYEIAVMQSDLRTMSPKSYRAWIQIWLKLNTHFNPFAKTLQTWKTPLVNYTQLKDVRRKPIIISILVVYITCNYIILCRKFLKSITTMIFMAYDNFLFIYDIYSNNTVAKQTFEIALANIWNISNYWKNQ